MTQNERIEKTTEIFKKAASEPLNTTFNDVQNIMDEYFNEHLSSVAQLELPFFVIDLERRLKFYKDELQQKPRLMLLHNLISTSVSDEKVITTTTPNIFAEKDGAKND